MNDDRPTAQLELTRDYFKERGFQTPLGWTVMRMASSGHPTDMRWDVVGFEMDTGRWVAFTYNGIDTSVRAWQSTDQFDDPVGAYLCAELENWGRS